MEDLKAAEGTVQIVKTRREDELLCNTTDGLSYDDRGRGRLETAQNSTENKNYRISMYQV